MNRGTAGGHVEEMEVGGRESRMWWVVRTSLQYQDCRLQTRAGTVVTQGKGTLPGCTNKPTTWSPYQVAYLAAYVLVDAKPRRHHLACHSTLKSVLQLPRPRSFSIMSCWCSQ